MKEKTKQRLIDGENKLVVDWGERRGDGQNRWRGLEEQISNKISHAI